MGSLQPSDWLQAALTRLSAHGIQDVRVELLARDLSASKGSFYWHFRDRADLLHKIFAGWEANEQSRLEAGLKASTAAKRWAIFIERMAEPGRMRLEVAIRNWARVDEKVAKSLATIDEKRAELIASVLRDIGFSPTEAGSWSEIVCLVCLGWMDRASCDVEREANGGGLGELLSEVVLAASIRTAAPQP